METTTKTKTCVNCGELVGPGRRDKKYCSEVCKTEYNNRRGGSNNVQTKPDPARKVIDILLRNRDILSACLQSGGDCCRLEKRDIMGRGFNFKYFTSQAPTLADEGYCFCFDMGYKEIGKGRLLIVRREREVIC